MRRLAWLPAALLCACASTVNGSGYDLAPGVATFEALNAASEKCHADGGEVVLKDSYDKRELSNYQCRIGRAK